MKDICARDIIVGGIVLLVFGFTVYITAVMTLNIAKRNQDAAINNAVSVALESAAAPAMTCKDQGLVNAVKELAINGVHLKGYMLKLAIGNIQGPDPWN